MSKRRAATAAAITLQQILAVDDSESEMSLSSLDDPESMLSVDESALKNGRKGKPATKRAKRSEASPLKRAPLALKKKGKQRLSLLPTMPLDVLFEILGLLSPKDLLSLSFTNKLFRETLLSSGARTVWKRALKSTGAPECPSDLSDLRWMKLLFWPFCESCGVKNTEEVDFCLRRRVCNPCKKENLIVPSEVASAFPNCDPLVLKLIPNTTDFRWARDRGGYNHFFWKSDIEEMMHLILVYKQKKDTHVPNAKNELDTFILERKNLMQNIEQNKKEPSLWLYKMEMAQHNEIQQLMKRRRDAIRAKFLELGYTHSDLSSLGHEKAYNQKAALTDIIWKRIRPKLEARVKARKDERVAREMLNARDIRRTLLRELRTNYKNTISPLQWKYLPSAVELGEKEPFKALIHAELDVTLTIDDFTPLMSKLPGVIVELQHELKANLIQKLADASEAGQVLPSNCLDLATSVFCCESAECKNDGYFRSDVYVVGPDSILSHNCGSTLRPSYDNPAIWTFEYSRKFVVARPAAVGTARALVLCAGLDPGKTLASEMDNKDLRFACKICGDRKFFGYSWRNALTHACTSTHLNLSHGVTITDHLNFWRVLPSAEAVFLKENEQKDPKWAARKWSCSHCPIALQDGGLHRNVVVQHVQTVHEIISPTDPTDLFYFEKVVTPFRQPEKILYGSL